MVLEPVCLPELVPERHLQPSEEEGADQEGDRTGDRVDADVEEAPEDDEVPVAPPQTQLRPAQRPCPPREWATEGPEADAAIIVTTLVDVEEPVVEVGARPAHRARDLRLRLLALHLGPVAVREDAGDDEEEEDLQDHGANCYHKDQDRPLELQAGPELFIVLRPGGVVGVVARDGLVRLLVGLGHLQHRRLGRRAQPREQPDGRAVERQLPPDAPRDVQQPAQGQDAHRRGLAGEPGRHVSPLAFGQECVHHPSRQHQGQPGVIALLLRREGLRLLLRAVLPRCADVQAVRALRAHRGEEQQEGRQAHPALPGLHGGREVERGGRR
mmetsp:Transcript_47210/g.145367  ORF Transcript_47210/g.145367 Transcript_47210/m.145367 type:complete len:327 (+) Transcript_47210:187-1167(+)